MEKIVKKERNVNIELLRCIACFFVIVIHTWGTFRMEGGTFHISVFAGGIFTRCAVPVFFLIMGFVFNAEKGLLHKYKQLVVRILIPVVLMTFFTSMILARGIHFFLDETQEYITFAQYFKMLLAGNLSDMYLSFHFWYIEEIVKFYLFLPLLQFILCREDKADKVRRFYLVLAGVAYIVIPFVEKFAQINLVKMYSPVGLYIWYILLGFELAAISQEEKKNKKYVGTIGLVCYLISALIMCLLEYFLEYKVDGDISHGFSDNDSLFVAVCAVGLFVFVLSLKIPERFHNAIKCVGKTTLGIYIVHVVVYSVIYQLHLTKLLEFMPVLVFCILYSLLVFAVSFIGIYILQLLGGFIRKMSIFKKMWKE